MWQNINAGYLYHRTANPGSNVTSRLRNKARYLPFNTPSLTRTGLNPTTTFEPDFFTDLNLVDPVLTINNRYRSDDTRHTSNMNSTVAFILTDNLIFRSKSGFDITYDDLSTFNECTRPPSGKLLPATTRICRSSPSRRGQQ